MPAGGTIAQALEDLRNNDRQTVAVNTYTASTVPQVADCGAIIEMNSASSTTITVAPYSSVPLPVKTRIDIVGLGAGTVTFVAGSGVTLRSKASATALSAQYSAASLYQRAQDDWVLVGDLA